MRAACIVGLLALLVPTAAMAQTASPPAAAAAAAPATHQAARRGGDITRDEYIERAKEAAARRFDRMDTDHNGVLTAEERRAYRESHSRRHRTAAAASPKSQ